jgi:hypothetical protein
MDFFQSSSLHIMDMKTPRCSPLQTKKRRAKKMLTINLKNDRAVYFWKKLLNINMQHLFKAVKKAGNSPEDVMNYIGDNLDDKFTDEFFYYHHLR